MSDHITVSGTGVASATPDCVAVQVRIESESESVATALSDCSERVTAALAAADALDIAPRDRQTTTIGVMQRYDAEGRRVVGYTAFQALALRTRDRGRVGDLLTALADAAGDSLRVEDVSLELSDVAELQRLAREAAHADARARAEHYAELSGRRLGRIRRLHEGGEPGRPQPRFAREAMAMAAASMPVESGESAVSQTVTVTWALTKPEKGTVTE